MRKFSFYFRGCYNDDSSSADYSNDYRKSTTEARNLGPDDGSRLQNPPRRTLARGVGILPLAWLAMKALEMWEASGM